jgi:hypothetical protein
MRGRREKVKMPRQLGSQFRETLEEAGYDLISLSEDGSEAILQDEGGKLEVWGRNDHSAGWVVEINGVGYAFVRTAP